jgi:hypothetical protein
MEHRRNPAVAVAAVFGGKRDDVGGQRRLVSTSLGRLPLRRAMLPQNPTCQALGEAKLRGDMLGTAAAASGAQKFPEAASRRISFSSVRSETAFRSRSFSFSRSFSRFT